MTTNNQWYQGLKRLVAKLVDQRIDERGLDNHKAFPDGKVAAVSADGKRADLYINGDATATKNVPIAPHVGQLTVGNEVIVLRRSPRDMIVLSKKPL